MRMIKYKKIRIGLRTLKTAAAVIISMAVVTSYGATTSRLIFAMLGAMAAMENTFEDSWRSCLTQVVGMIFGALAGVLLLSLSLPSLVSAGLGIVFVITLYNIVRLPYSPSLPCLIVVTLCTTPDVQPIVYALGRLWDTAIGLGVGMLINTLIFPYDNSQRIRSTVECLDQELLRFLEDMFDGDNILPDTKKMSQMTDHMASQLNIFSKQRMFLYLRRNRWKLEAFRVCQGKARQLVAEMEVLCRIKSPGRLSEENRKHLEECGAVIRDQRKLDSREDLDIVTNYHVEQILHLRRDLMRALKKSMRK